MLSSPSSTPFQRGNTDSSDTTWRRASAERIIRNQKGGASAERITWNRKGRAGPILLEPEGQGFSPANKRRAEGATALPKARLSSFAVAVAVAVALAVALAVAAAVAVASGYPKASALGLIACHKSRALAPGVCFLVPLTTPFGHFLARTHLLENHPKSK